MQSGVEENTNVNHLDLEIKIEENSSDVSSEDSKSIDTQVDMEKNKHVIETSKYNSKNSKPLTPCLKKRNSSETIIQTNTGKNKKYQYKLKNKSQNSDSNLVAKPTGLSKILTWDPWLKIGRNKNKKDKHKKNENKQKITATDHHTGDGPKSVSVEKKSEENTLVYQSEISNNEYLEYNVRPAKVTKIVRFHTDVKVVHFKEDEVFAQTIEPLKKEIEQQERNKELRKEVTPETGLGLKQKKTASDYMSAWYKK